jgi:hypothetical protein
MTFWFFAVGLASATVAVIGKTSTAKARIFPVRYKFFIFLPVVLSLNLAA